MTDPKKRFSSRVENYKKYRPAYPPQLLKFLKEELNLSPENILADIGSGTGILTEMLLLNGNIVYAVEPNEEMRTEAENSLKKYKNFFSIDGSSESTNIKSDSIDFIFAAQAFHWFRLDQTKKEFIRILNENGWVILIWNTRNNNASSFLKAYEKFLQENSIDYAKVDHTKISEETLKFFYKNFDKRIFTNTQRFDYEGLKGRVLSSSYMPSEENPGYEKMIINLENLFADFNNNNQVEFIYNTEVYFGKI